MGSWMGVDVGGARKRFDVCLLEGDRVAGLRARQSVEQVRAWASEARPSVVAIDSPRSCAPPGATRRESERLLVASRVCGIRWTPALDVMRGRPYYEWILEGLALHRALEELPGLRVVECFPTASWTRWAGPRGGRPRAQWSQDALAGLGLAGVPARLNQDQRDAIGAAATARAFERGECEVFGGEIVVPYGRRSAPPPRQSA